MCFIYVKRVRKFSSFYNIRSNKNFHLTKFPKSIIIHLFWIKFYFCIWARIAEITFQNMSSYLHRNSWLVIVKNIWQCLTMTLQNFRPPMVVGSLSSLIRSTTTSSSSFYIYFHFWLLDDRTLESVFREFCFCFHERLSDAESIVFSHVLDMGRIQYIRLITNKCNLKIF